MSGRIIISKNGVIKRVIEIADDDMSDDESAVLWVIAGMTLFVLVLLILRAVL